MDNETQQTATVGPAPKNKKQLLLILLIVLMLLALGGLGYLYLQQKNGKQLLAKKEAEKIALQEKLDKCSDKADAAVPAGDDTDVLPVVIFSPGGVFTDAEKTEITAKMIGPYRAWHRDQGDSLASIHVQQDVHVPGQYVVDVIYQGGVYEGFLYGAIDAATQDWWFPECLDACEFTAEFTATYPEVVAAAGS